MEYINKIVFPQFLAQTNVFRMYNFVSPRWGIGIKNATPRVNEPWTTNGVVNNVNGR